MLDNRYVLLFIRGERAVQDGKYDLLHHPNIRFTVDGVTPPYVHGQAPLAHDTNDILLDGDYADYEVLSEDDLNKILIEETEEQIK